MQCAILRKNRKCWTTTKRNTSLCVEQMECNQLRIGLIVQKTQAAWRPHFLTLLFVDRILAKYMNANNNISPYNSACLYNLQSRVVKNEEISV